MLLNDFLDQTRVDVVPAADDKVLCAAGYKDTALLIGVGEIAAVDQTWPDSRAVVFRISITRRDDRPTDCEDADLIRCAPLPQRPVAVELPNDRLDVGNPDTDRSDHPCSSSGRE